MQAPAHREPRQAAWHERPSHRGIRCLPVPCQSTSRGKRAKRTIPVAGQKPPSPCAPPARGQNRPAVNSQHYFTPQPQVASHPSRVHLKLPDLELDLLTDRGVFAYGQVDRGTQTLLRTIPAPAAGSDLLDLGCGYGAVSTTLAKRCPTC